MTIGIGVLATGDEGRKTEIIPDHAILISDTMGSFGDEYSHPRLHKRFDLPDEGLFIVAADQIDKAAEVVPMIKAVVAAVPRKRGAMAGFLPPSEMPALCTKRIDSRWK